MADFLKHVRHKSIFSEIMYYSLNIGLVVVLLVLSLTIHSPLIAIILVLLSKWRVFAVRPRYWWTNLQSNTVDIIVGLSFVLLMYMPQVSVVFQVIMAVLYALWLVVLKPSSKRRYIMLQSFVAIALGTISLYAISYEWPVIFVVGSMAIIGYGAARHFLQSFDEDQTTLISLIWGLLFAEVGWLAYYWTFAYSLPFLPSLKVPQVTIIVLLMSFMGERIYRSWAKNQKIVVGDIILPIVFSVLLIGFMVLFFNSVTI